MFRKLKLLGALATVAVVAVAACESPTTAPVQRNVQYTPALNTLEGGTPFACSGEAFTVRLSPAQLYQIDQSTDPFGFIPIGGIAQLDIPAGLDPFNPLGGLTPIELNNLGFRSTNGHLYAMALKLFVENSSGTMGNYGIVKIDANGTVHPVALPAPGIPSIGSNLYRLPAGDVTPDGSTMYINTQITSNVEAGVSNTLFVVDLAALEADPTDASAVDPVTKSWPAGIASVTVADWAVNPFDGMLYGAAPTPSPARIWKLNPNNGEMSIVPGSGAIGLPIGTTPTEAYGGVWFGGSGNLFLYRNVGTIYEIDLDGEPGPVGGCAGNCPKIISIQDLGPESNYNDAAACVAGDIEIQKTVFAGAFDEGQLPGGEFVGGANGDAVTYVFNVTNTGSTYLDNISVTDLNLGITEAEMTVYSGSLEAPLAPGESVVLYYETEIDGDLLNTASASGNPTDDQGNDIPNLPDPTDDDTAEVDEVDGGVFACTETGYVIQGTGGILGTERSWLTEIDQSVSPFVFNQIPNASTFLGGRINNLGFNPADGLLYAWRIPSTTPTVTASLLTIDPAGTIDLLGVPAGMPTVNPNANLNAGDVSDDGTKMYLTNSGGYGNENLYVVDLATLTLDATLQIRDEAGGTQLGRVNDFAFNPIDGLLYGGDQDDGELAILDPATGIRTDVALAGLPIDGSPNVVRFGGAYFGSDGTLYLYENVSGSIYPVSDVTGTPTLGTAIPGTPSTDVDAASCAALIEDPPGDPSVYIEKSTNGEDADDPTGPEILVDGAVTWTYLVTNTGNVPLTDVTVTDNMLADADIDCGGDGDNVIESLEANGGQATCTATGKAEAGQYANEGTASSLYGGQLVEDTDPSHYFGVAPSVAIEKSTNGEDADDPTGPEILVGETVTWTYVVTNDGNVPLTDVTVTDDQLADDAAEISCDDGNGTDNVIETLAANGGQVTCTAAGTAEAGQYANEGKASSQYDGQDVEATDPSHYLGVESFVAIDKTTNGEPASPSQDIQFTLFYGTTNLETVSTLNVGANLLFTTSLFPGDGYTICEYPVPAGYTFEVGLDGVPVQTEAGPPGEQNPSGEIQCFNFTAADNGLTLTFDIENSFPGGAPRTPGYWKNWNTCSGGNQAETAYRLNEGLGPVEGNGVYLLDDLLPQTVGRLEVDQCDVGVNVLDTRNIQNGRKMGGDAGYILARSYLAANLNLDAGACPATGFTFDLSAYGLGDALTFQQVLNAAQQVLYENDYDGTGRSIGNRDADRDLALALYEIIDDYNNGEICTGVESH